MLHVSTALAFLKFLSYHNCNSHFFLDQFLIFDYSYIKQSNAIVTNYFKTFLQTVDVANFFIRFHLDSTLISFFFSFTNNYSPHQPFVKFFVYIYILYIYLQHYSIKYVYHSSEIFFQKIQKILLLQLSTMLNYGFSHNIYVSFIS